MYGPGVFCHRNVVTSEGLVFLFKRGEETGGERKKLRTMREFLKLCVDVCSDETLSILLSL